MSWDPVPWFVGGGAQHSAEVARLLAYIATGGAEGVLDPLDLRVMELATPSTALRVMPGACAIRNRALGGAYQTYLARMVSQDEVGVTPTTVSGGRSDLVIAQVENSHISGEPYQPPADPTAGPYVFTRIIENVGQAATDVHDLNLGLTATTLARLDIPASTGTLTSSMITDLRSVAANLGGQRVGDDMLTQSYWTGTAVGTGKWNSGAPALTPSNTSFVNWPPGASWTVPIPAGATHMDIDVRVINAHLNGGDAWGEQRLVIGGTPLPPAVFDLNQGGLLNFFENSGGFRQGIGVGGTYAIDPALRGTTVNVHLEARNYVDARVKGSLYFDSGTYTFAFLNFKKLPTQE